MSAGRLQVAFARAVAAVTDWVWAGSYRYSVASCDWDAQTLELRPLSGSHPPLSGVRMRSPGLRLDIAPGTEVLVRYESLDPTRPYVADYGTAPGSVLRVDILGGVVPVALQGMAVQVTLSGAQVASLGLLGNLGAPISPPPGPTSVIVDGTITGGSATVRGLA
jgi:hypothetical protein